MSDEHRPLRFRVWDNETMHYPEVVEIGINSWNGLTSASFQLGSGYCTSAHVMQFTGLKDKAGRDIYEGDIVQDHIILHDTQEAEETPRVFVVYWDAKTASFWQKLVSESDDPKSYRMGHNFAAEKTCEVMGNIYEDTALLDGLPGGDGGEIT